MFNNDLIIPMHMEMLYIEDAKALFPYFQNFKVSSTHHSGNFIAHALARRAKQCSNALVWMEEVPPDIVSVLLNNFYAF